MASVYGSDSRWVEEKPTRQNGGMSDALSIAAHIGFPVLSPPSQNLSFRIGETSYDFIRILHELTTLQGKVSDLQVQLHGRKEDKNVGHLTHVSEMEKKIETLARITAILKGAIQNKKQFVELIMNAASDYGTLTTSVSDLQWAQNFKEPPSVWGEMLRPIPVALAQCARYFEAMNAMRESFATLQKLRTYSSQLPSEYHSRITSPIDSECVSPCSSRTGLSSDDLDLRSVINQDVEKQQEEDDKYTDVDDINDIRLAWPSGNENDL
ncbi:AUGMIN subunit 2-like isoform X2 [Cynara cardunculus var. scolymus]|uniref:AUGMIN subunit 2-like isoform X2 n=1 Tax=Cynara cardunculus var. scolymus TaxID=59895 RepID=UPI000D62DD00|nr:AUGMIN subunit 2-like isoform X2 [Cynara cardunculus var. scolymus]